MFCLFLSGCFTQVLLYMFLAPVGDTAPYEARHLSGFKVDVKWLAPVSTQKEPFSKRQKIGFQDQLSLNAGQKYCRMLQREHSAILLTFIKLPFVIKVFVLSIFEWLFYTGFTAYVFSSSWCDSAV